MPKEQTRRERLQNMTDAEYLLTPEYEQLRAKVLVRDGYHCRICRATSMLTIFSGVSERRGREQMSDVIVLCEECYKIACLCLANRRKEEQKLTPSCIYSTIKQRVLSLCYTVEARVNATAQRLSGLAEEPRGDNNDDF